MARFQTRKVVLPEVKNPQTGLLDCDMVSSVMDRERPQDQNVLVSLAKKNNYNLLPHHIKSGCEINWVDSMDRTAIHWAASSGSYEALLQLINLGANIMVVDKFGMTPLLWAAWYGHTKCFIKLVKLYKKNLLLRNKQRMNILHCVAANNQPHLVDFIGECIEGFPLNAKDIYGMTALHMAADEGHYDVVVKLLAFEPKTEAVDKLGSIPLHYACKNGSLPIFKALLKAGSAPDFRNHQGLTPLHYAVISEQRKVVKQLLKVLNKAQLNIGSETGETALMTAGTMGNVDIFKMLIKSPNIDVNARDANGNTVCHLICRRTENNAEILQILLNSNKLDINIANDRGEIALHSAIEYNEAKIVDMLINAGSSLYINTKYGNSPLILAAKSGDTDCVDLVIKGQRVHMLTDNDNFFKDNFCPVTIKDETDSDDSDREIIEETKSQTSRSTRRSEHSETTVREDVHSNLGSEDLDEDLRDQLLRTSLEEVEEDRPTDVLDDFKENISGDLEENISISTKKDTIYSGISSVSSVSLDSIEEIQETKLQLTKNLNFLKELGNKNDPAKDTAEVSSVSTVSFTALEEAKEVRNQLFKNLSYLKEHEKLVAKNFSSFEEVEEVSKKFQKDLKAVLFVEDEENIENTDQIDKKPREKKKKKKIKKETKNDEQKLKTESYKEEHQEKSKKPHKNKFFGFDPFHKKEKSDTKERTSPEKEEKEEKKEFEGEEESESSSYEDSIDDSVDMDIFEPFDQTSNISSSDLNEEKEQDEALMSKMKTVLWNVAYKKMKKDDWLKLAKNWNFNEAHIRAIQFDSSKATSNYRENSYRLLSIWLDSFRITRPDDSPVQSIHAAFSKINRQALADNILQKMHQSRHKKGCTIS